VDLNDSVDPGMEVIGGGGSRLLQAPEGEELEGVAG
jgi:hypothetical protein